MIIYNGVDLSPYMKITDIRGRGLIQADFTEIVAPGRPGSYFVSKQKPKRILENDYKILAHTQTELRQKIDELNAILDVEEHVPIVYADEPDKTYYGIAYSDGQEQQILSLQKGTLVFVCFDPYKYGPTRSQTINDPSGGQANPIIINEGTAETYPTFTAQILKPITFLQIVSPDSYMQIGQPVAVKQTSGVKEENIFHDAMESLTGWGATTTIAEGYIKGSIIQSGGGFKAGDFGQTDPYTPDWQGPALKKSLNPTISGDFMVEAWLFHLTQAGTTGRVEIDALDAANNIIARMFLEDKWIGLEQLGGQLQLGGVASPATKYIKLPGKLEQFDGRIRMERHGNEWTFSILQHAENSSNIVKTWSAKYIDVDGSHNQAIAQLQVVFQKYHDTAPNNMEIYSLRAWKYNDIGDQVAYIADVDDVIEFDHRNAVIRKNGEVWMMEKDFGASFFPIGKGQTELAVNPSDAAIVTVKYQPRWL